MSHFLTGRYQPTFCIHSGLTPFPSLPSFETRTKAIAAGMRVGIRKILVIGTTPLAVQSQSSPDHLTHAPPQIMPLPIFRSFDYPPNRPGRPCTGPRRSLNALHTSSFFNPGNAQSFHYASHKFELRRRFIGRLRFN